MRAGLLPAIVIMGGVDDEIAGVAALPCPEGTVVWSDGGEHRGELHRVMTHTSAYRIRTAFRNIDVRRLSARTNGQFLRR